MVILMEKETRACYLTNIQLPNGIWISTSEPHFPYARNAGIEAAAAPRGSALRAPLMREQGTCGSVPRQPCASCACVELGELHLKPRPRDALINRTQDDRAAGTCARDGGHAVLGSEVGIERVMTTAVPGGSTRSIRSVPSSSSRRNGRPCAPVLTTVISEPGEGAEERVAVAKQSLDGTNESSGIVVFEKCKYYAGREA